MDWHFKVNRRITESEKQGQHRSWYVDKDDWVNSRETIDEDRVPELVQPISVAGSSAPKGPQLQYLPVPDDPALANSVCPICQEKFETRWLDEAQEFVWPDAIKANHRIYHASCHREATQDDVMPPAGYSSSIPVLGKRKAEVSCLDA
jgi:pre-mRNA cleavage complex 2 protein Pcf11